MKTITLVLTAVFAAAGAAKAADVETMSAELEKAGITVTVGSHHTNPPKPGVPQPVNVKPGHHPKPPQTHPTHPHQPSYPYNPSYPGYNPVPSYPTYNPVPPYPTYPPYNPPPSYPPYNPVPTYPTYPPAPPPYEQTEHFRFESGQFTFSSEARRSMDDAAEALRRAGHTVLEKRLDFNAYTLVFLAPSRMKVETYRSGSFTFSSEAKRAADECAAALESERKVVVEKRVNGTSFTISYLTRRWAQMETQTYNSGQFTFGTEAKRAMDEAVAALRGLDAVILEQHQNGTSYTVIFQSPYRLDFQTHKSGVYTFSSEARRAMDETVAALKRVRRAAVLEKRQTGTSYEVVFVADFRLRPLRYDSGFYTFSSEARRAADETAEALASQGMIVLEKNVRGTQFTIVYFRPGYQY